MAKFYVTNAIPYVNAKPHIGHALEFVQSDTITRYHRQKGEEVLLLCGSDENALKNVQAAEAAGVPVQEFVDKNAALFQELAQRLNVQFDVFQKGSDPKHHASSQKLWELCDKAGDIYKASYEGLYCTGCETFYALEELDENQECYEHPGKKLEKVAEENYFFRLSKYQDRLRQLIETDELRIVPGARKNEVLAFLQQFLQDISISRSNERAKNWGVSVPGDDSQRMYVWFDALNIYQSGIGFGSDEERYRKWWPADAHVIGKGILRFHAIYWPAFLLSAGLPLPKTLFVHGYVTVRGQKMSKSLGNVVDPFELVAKYGTDAVRYYFLREIPSTQDGDFSLEKFEARYNGDLAAGLGNLVARVLTMAQKWNPDFEIPSSILDQELREAETASQDARDAALEAFDFSGALEALWTFIHTCDRHIEQKRPWEESSEQETSIVSLLGAVSLLAQSLVPFLPDTAERITQQLEARTPAPLFPRLP